MTLSLVPRLTSREIALTGVMAALMAVAAFIPVTVVAGVGKVISAAVVLEPFIGVFLGPALGLYAAGTGAFVGQIIAPQGNVFHYLTFLPPTAGTITAGFLACKRWKSAAAVMAGGLLLWYSTSVGRELFYYPYLSALFLVTVFISRHHLGEWVHADSTETVGVQKAGVTILMAGLLLVTLSGILLFGVTYHVFVLGIAVSSLATLLVLSEGKTARKIAIPLFITGGLLLLYGNVLHPLITVLLCITLLSFAFFAAGYSPAPFMVAFPFFGICFVVVYAGISRLSTASTMLLIVLPLLIAGILSFPPFCKRPGRRWSGFFLFLAGMTGIVFQILSFSQDSQAIKRELLNLPATTFVLGKEINITVASYYLKKVIPLFAEHLGMFLVFTALLLLGFSLFLNVSVEKLTIAYFIISGCAVLSDLMVGNFLAISILGLQSGMFKAYLFIYPVERMFMAFFSTIFGIGVFIPLRKYGFVRKEVTV